MRYLAFLIITAITFKSFAQSQMNEVEWIKEQSSYYKIRIAQEGIYRIDGKTLKSYGIDITKTPSSLFKVFYRGKEIALFKSNGNNFTEQDYIEFYAQRRDGKRDSSLYYPHNGMPHHYYSMFSDTSYYYLSIGNEQGKNMQFATLQDPSTLNIINHTATDRYIYADEFSHNTFTGPTPIFQYSTFDNGEAMTGKRLKNDTTYTVSYELQNPHLSTVQPAKISLIINGRSSGRRHIEILITTDKGILSKDTLIISDYMFGRLVKEVMLPPNTSKINITTTANAIVSSDFYSISLVEITYPQALYYANFSKTYNILSHTNSILKIPLQTQSSWYGLYDITDEQNPIRIPYELKDKSIVAQIASNSKDRKLFLTHQYIFINKIEKVEFKKIDPSSYNYIIVTNNKLLAGAQAYENYRKSSLGGNFKTLLLTTEQVYDQFNYGEHSPLAIMNLAKYINQDKGNDKFLLLLGKAHSLYDARPRLEQLDLVPSLGYPASDNLLTSTIDSNSISFVPTMLTGRIPATTNEQIVAYLDKLKKYESSSFDLWRKNMLHLSGGSNPLEVTIFQQFLKPIEEIATNSYVAANVQALSKKTNEPIEIAPISDIVNNGVGMISFLGHSSPAATDFNIGNATDPTRGYNNQHYPLLFFNGCSYTNTFRDIRNSQALDWLFASSKGAIGVLGQSYINDLYAIVKYMNIFYKLQFQDPTYYTAPLGKVIQQAAIEVEKNNPSYLDLINIQQMLLLGDPALRLFPISKPDYYVSKIFVESTNSTQPLALATNWKVGIIVGNKGKIDTKTTTKLSFNIETNTTSTFETTIKVPIDTLYFTVKNGGSTEQIQVTVDAKKEIDEVDENNNIATLTFPSSILSQTSVYPFNSVADKIAPILAVAINGQTPTFNYSFPKGSVLTLTLQDNLPLLAASDTAKIEATLQPKCSQCVAQRISLKLLNATPINKLTWQTNLNLSVGKYDLILQATDLRGNKAYQTPIVINFEITEPSPVPIAIAYPNPFSEYLQVLITRPKEFSANQCVIEFFSADGKLIDTLETTLIYPAQNIYWQLPLLSSQSIFYQIRFKDAPTPITIRGKLVKE